MGQTAHVAPPDVVDWTPAVLTEYEIGRAILAAEIIARAEKPVAEIGACKAASVALLEADLWECVRLAGHAENVSVWTRATSGGRVRYGFYREAWALDALDFLDRAELRDGDRAWIQGLLFGYRADAIQAFIARTVQIRSEAVACPACARSAAMNFLPFHDTSGVVHFKNEGGERLGRGSTPGPTRLGDAYFIGSPALHGVRTGPGGQTGTGLTRLPERRHRRRSDDGTVQ